MREIPWNEILSFSGRDLLKLLGTAVIIVMVTKVQVFSDRLSALLVALPLTSVIAMSWMHVEKQPSADIARHAESTFWFVLPTLPMFLILPWMLRSGWGFWPSLAACCAVTIGCFLVVVGVLRAIGIDLLAR